MFGLMICYSYLISTSFTARRFYIVDDEILRPSKKDATNIDFNKPIDNSEADYKDAFEMKIVHRRKHPKFQNFIKNNSELWKDANEITRQTLIKFLQSQYRKKSMLGEDEP